MITWPRKPKITNKIAFFKPKSPKIKRFRWSIFYHRRSAEKPGKTAIIGQKRPIYGGFSKLKYRACGSSARRWASTRRCASSVGAAAHAPQAATRLPRRRAAI
jgi:hypothetical protein